MTQSKPKYNDDNNLDVPDFGRTPGCVFNSNVYATQSEGPNNGKHNAQRNANGIWLLPPNLFVDQQHNGAL